MALRLGPLDAVPAGEKNQEPLEPADHALGRSKGGFGTKLHILCDAEGHPLYFELSAGTAINVGGMFKLAFIHRYLRLCAPC